MKNWTYYHENKSNVKSTIFNVEVTVLLVENV